MELLRLLITPMPIRIIIRQVKVTRRIRKKINQKTTRIRIKTINKVLNNIRMDRIHIFMLMEMMGIMVKLIRVSGTLGSSFKTKTPSYY
jgi:DNA polymerase I-like protein with 3'-5' exonuclease and polymerase domains